MKKKKVGIVASSVAAIAVCTSVIAGSTYALFTSEDKVNIAVTAGKVDVTASVALKEVFSPETIDYVTGVPSEKNGVDPKGTTFKNGGKVSVNGGEVKLENFMPGDKVKLGVTINDTNTTVNYKYRVKLGFDGDEANKAFYESLLIGVGEYFYSDFVSDWKESTEKTTEVTLELPAYTSNKYQGKSCDISVAVEAVQGNGATGTGDAKKTYILNDETKLADTLSEVKDGETIVLAGGNKVWDEVVLNFAQTEAEAKSINVRGYNVGTLTVNAPFGTVNYFNTVTEKVVGQAVANKSLHIFGKVTESVTLNKGRVVIEEGAQSEKIIVNATENAETTVVVEEKAVVTTLDVQKTSGKSVLENKGVIGKMQSAENTQVTVSKDSTGKVEAVTGNGVMNVDNADSLKAAIKAGGKIKLTENITVSKGSIRVNKDTDIDLNGKTLTMEQGGMIVGNYRSEIAPKLVVSNGFVVNTYQPTNWSGVGLCAEGHGELTVNGVTIDSLQAGITVWDFAKLEANNCTINSQTFYGVSTNAGAGNYSDAIYVKLNNCTIDSKLSAGVLWNIPAKMVVNGGSITGKTQGLIARGGNVDITGTTLTCTAEEDTFGTGAWATGSKVNSGALVLGNKQNNSYAYSTTVNLKGVTVNAENVNAVYMWSHNSTAFACSLNFDEATVISGSVLTGGENCIINGLAVKNVATAEELVAACAAGGYVKLTADIVSAEQVVVPENVVTILDLNGHELESQYAGVSVWNYGTLTVKGNGRLHNTSEESDRDNFSHDAIRNSGVLTIENGTFGDCDEDRTNANTEHRGAAIRNLAGAVCTILDGNFTCGDNYYTWGTGTGYSYAIRNSGELTIENANLYGAMNGGVSSDAGGKTTINGGTFSVTGEKSYYVLVSGGGEMTITGGTFIKENSTIGGLLGGFSGMPSWDASTDLEANGYTVTGGTFIKDGETVTFDQNN